MWAIHNTILTNNKTIRQNNENNKRTQTTQQTKQTITNNKKQKIVIGDKKNLSRKEHILMSLGNTQGESTRRKDLQLRLGHTINYIDLIDVKKKQGLF
jgi:RNase H-fold protein (predicted Holliday junction resolvase)